MREVAVQNWRYARQLPRLGGRGEHAGEVAAIGADLETGADHHEAGHLLGEAAGHVRGELAAVGPAEDGETFIAQLGSDSVDDRVEGGVGSRFSRRRAPRAR